MKAAYGEDEQKRILRPGFLAGLIAVGYNGLGLRLIIRNAAVDDPYRKDPDKKEKFDLEFIEVQSR